jgi:hypothetical protein
MIGMPIKNRYRFHSEIPIYFTQFANFVQDMEAKLAGTNLLADQTRSDIISKITEMSSYLNVIKMIMESKKHYEDLGISIDEVLIKLETFK